MKLDTLIKVESKLKELQGHIKLLKSNNNDIENWGSCRYRAQVKRTSMDLTRLLADLRLDR